MKLLLDTDVLVDYFVGREPFVQDWVKLRIMETFGDAELWVSAKSFADVCYLAKKPVGGELLQKAFVDSFSFLNVCSIGPVDVRAAAEASWDDFEDCLIYMAACKVKADVIITRDVRGFSLSSIPSQSLAEFFDWLEESKGVSYSMADLPEA